MTITLATKDKAKVDTKVTEATKAEAKVKEDFKAIATSAVNSDIQFATARRKTSRCRTTAQQMVYLRQPRMQEKEDCTQ